MNFEHQFHFFESNFLIFILILFLLSFVLTYIVKEIAIKKSLYAQVSERSSHSVATPHGGGIALALTWFIGITYLYYTNDINSSLYYALMVGIIISVVSYFDDLFELSAKLRLAVQASVSILGLYFLGGLEQIDLIVFSIENSVFTNVFAFFLIIWFINLYNFLDGIDGYAGSQAVFLGLAGYIIFGDSHFLVLISASLGFLVWNWHKAKIFMGDVGSTLLGYNIAIFTIFYQNASAENEGTSILLWITLFGVFVFDATYTLIRRKLNAESISTAHKKHAYQRLVQSGFSHDKVVIYSIFVNITLFFIVYFISNLLVSFSIAFVLLYFINRFVDSKKRFK